MISSKDSGLWQIRSLGPIEQRWTVAPNKESVGDKGWVAIPIPSEVTAIEISRYDPGLNIKTQTVRDLPA